MTINEQPGESGRLYYCPNKLGRIALLSFEDVMGRKGLNTVLNLAKLRHLINNYPPNNLDLSWSFSEMAALNQGLEDLHGSLGGRGLAIRSGRASLYHILKDFGAVLGIGDLTFRFLPFRRKMRATLLALAETFNKTSDQVVRLEEEPDHFLYRVERCPVCWGRSAEEPICHVTLGLLQEAMFWATRGKNIRVEEVACLAAGDAACTFSIDRRPMR